MTKDKAKILVMKDLLIQCEHTISFLRNCLLDTDELQYKYTYPHHEVPLLQELQRNYKGPGTCYHSHYVDECKDCRDTLKYKIELNEAKEILNDRI